MRSALRLIESRRGVAWDRARTDARIDPKVRVVDVFPDDTHMPIVYPIALTAVARAEAKKFIDYVRGPVANATFKKYGFTPLN